VRASTSLHIDHTEFSEIGRRAFVEVGFRDFDSDGHKQTVSRVAVLTGLSRKEVLHLAFITLFDGHGWPNAVRQERPRNNLHSHILHSWAN